MLLIRIGVFEEQAVGCPKDNLYVKNKAPVLDIKHVQAVPGMKIVEVQYLSPVAFRLGQTSHARLHGVTVHISGDLFAKNFVHWYRMGSGTHYRHFSAEHIDQLREFIQAASSQKRAQTSNPVIVPFRLFYVGFFIDHHRPEFIAIERPVVLAMS